MNANRTNIIIEQAKRETEFKKITENIEKLELIKERPTCTMDLTENNEMPMPLYYGNQRDIHPKKIISEMEKYFMVKKITGDDQMIIIENSLKNEVALWYTMMKFASPNYEKFK